MDQTLHIMPSSIFSADIGYQYPISWTDYLIASDIHNLDCNIDRYDLPILPEEKYALIMNSNQLQLSRLHKFIANPGQDTKETNEKGTED